MRFLSFRFFIFFPFLSKPPTSKLGRVLTVEKYEKKIFSFEKKISVLKKKISVLKKKEFSVLKKKDLHSNSKNF